jgi:DNA-binding NtrC family response regulator
MPSLRHQKRNSPDSRPRRRPEIHGSPKILVLTPNLEVRQPLLRTLDRLSADTIACSTRAQAEELLSQQEFALIFCDEHLSDGSYQDLVHSPGSVRKAPPLVVTTRTGEWDLYFKALAKGAFDIVRAPWHATDIEMILIRALRENEHPATSAATA